MKSFVSLLAVALWALPVQVFSAETGELPIFDTHMHYSRGAWDAYSPAQILGILNRAGVTRALVSSTPDGGTFKLMVAAPKRVVPAFRPYRVAADLGRWYENPDLLAYSEARLAQGRYRAFGEVHLYRPENLNTPEMTRYLDIIAGKGLYLQPHADAAVVEALFLKRPDLKILWAHAGFFESAAVVGRMLDRYPALWTELSYRAVHIMPGDALEAEWKALLIRHADRFTIGTDTWAVDRWHGYQGLIGEHREWLRRLPRDVAEKIAYGNADRLFGSPR